MNDIDTWTNDIHHGDARKTLSEIPESSVHMVMTSPPYFGLRDYGEEGQIGLEDSLDEYVGELVDVFREVRRVLRPDGSAWLNLGDTYSGGGGAAGKPTNHDDLHTDDNYPDNPPARKTRFGRKNKMLVPHRVAIALQDDGWIVRNDVTWVKPNPMPSSVKDRLNTTTEQIFHLTAEPDYWYDLDAIREPHAEVSRERMKQGPTNHETTWGMTDAFDEDKLCHPAGKNPGDVFEVTTKSFPEAHFAVYPPELVEKPLKATCPPKVCAECGSPYERETVKEERPDMRPRDVEPNEYEGNTDEQNNRSKWVGTPKVTTDEWWEPTCDCDTDATEAGIALDPFAGAGTTAMVAKDLGRRFIGIDLNDEYVAMAQKRLGLTVDNPEYVRDNADSGLEEWT